jgi:class I fructose-bisphosphate aldolase
MEADTTGLIFGRNIWQREHGESLRFITRRRDILAKHPSR